jgi:cytochrome c biogenesis protein CcdA
VCFVTSACENCEKARAYLGRLPESVNLAGGNSSPVRVIYYNVAENEGLAAARRFCEAYQVPDNEQLVPLVFYTAGYLSGYANIQRGVLTVLATGKAQNFAFPGAEGEIPALNRLELPAVFLAGLLGGLNPCSVSMLLLLLSLLAAKNAHVLPLGLSYVASKLLTYLVLGLALFTLARSLDLSLFHAAQGLVRVAVIALSLLLCFLNALDFVNARRENYGAIRVQLPRALRRFNHSIIRKTVEGNPRYLMAAVFALGVLVSAGEFLCTGQIYLATILYLLRTGAAGLALPAFLCYTVAAALPPALLVILCHKGKQAMALSDFVRDRMPAVKIANTLFFALFAGFAFFFF